MIHYIADYLINISECHAAAEIDSGYLRLMLPRNASEKSKLWDDIMKDVEQIIMPDITHCQHP
ncbi:unnamed protein product, partial [Rotaria sp. Silwood1]